MSLVDYYFVVGLWTIAIAGPFIVDTSICAKDARSCFYLGAFFALKGLLQ